MSIVEKALKKKNTNKKNKPNSIDAVEDSIALRLLCRPLIKAENFIVDTLRISFGFVQIYAFQYLLRKSPFSVFYATMG